MGCAGSCHQTRPSTVSNVCSRTLASTPSREPSTTCPFLLHCMANQTCRLTSLRRPVPQEPRLLMLTSSSSFPNLPKYLLAPCWSVPSSDCENINVMILSRFETMVILSSILRKCQTTSISTTLSTTSTTTNYIEQNL